VGDRAPEFEFQGSDGELYTLKGLLSGGKRGIVLAFFPKAFTPG
jgi:peroxiredoxin